MANGIVLNIDTTKSEFQNPMVQLRQGDGNYQSLSVTVTSNGEPFDLTGWTITFMGTTAGGFKIVDADSVVTNAVQGEFTYTPTKAWGQDQGEFKNAYFKFVKSDETASGASFRVNVLDAVDLTAEEAKDYISVVDVMIDQVKTDMNNKLAETKQTLTDTQSQANTVQANVNDLNTNVNDLKAQNNNIKTSDNTWTGTNTFNNKIIAPAGTQGNADTATKLQTPRTIGGVTFDGGSNIDLPGVNKAGNQDTSGRAANATNADHANNASSADLSTKAVALQTPRKINGTNFDGTADITVDPVVKYINTDTDLFTLSNGFYYFNGIVATNKPSTASNWFTVEVIQTESDGFMRLIDNGGLSFWTTKSGSTWRSWRQDANDANVVHNTGTETIAGNKTFTGNNSFKGVQVLAQSATVEFPMWFGSKMKATRFGNMVVLGYSIAPTQDIPGGTSTISEETVPVGFRPSFDWFMSVSGVSSTGGSAVKIRSDGKLAVASAFNVAYPGTMTATYFTNDVFPTN